MKLLPILKSLISPRLRHIAKRGKCRLEGVPKAFQKIVIEGRGSICFGAGVSFGWERSPKFKTSYAYIDARNRQSRIEIGENTVFSNDAAIISEWYQGGAGITIGRNCVVGVGFRCYDSDFHPLHVADRNDGSKVRMKPVRIGNDVFIGENVICLKGSEIGDGSVIGAGSVVCGKFPPNSVIAGNPAKVIRTLGAKEVRCDQIS
jgi:maltose O-acetyltransferase